MKFLFKICIVFAIISICLSVQLSSTAEAHRKKHKKKVAVDGLCDEAQKTKKCDKGLKCFPIVTKLGKNIKVDWKCKAENYRVAVGDMCIYQTFGSQCQRDGTTYATCKDIKTYVDWYGKKSKVGICRAKGKNTQLSSKALTRSQSLKTTPILNVPSYVSLDEDEITFINDAFDEIEQLIPGKDAFTVGYIILQYFVDEDEIKNKDIVKKILKPYLAHMRSQGRKCEDIEAELDFKGVHVVNTWTSKERNQYLWMVNNNYIKGLQGAYDKALLIKGVADATQGTASKIMGEFASNAEIAGGFIKTLVDLAVQTVVNKQITNALLAASSNQPTSGTGASDPKAIRIFKKSGDKIQFGEGFGMIPANSICKELKVDAGLKYMTGVRKGK